MVETYLELTLTALINVQFLRFDYLGEAISAVLSIGFSIIMVSQPFLILIYMKKNFGKLKTENF